MWRIEQQIDLQAGEQICWQLNEQVGQIKQKLNESLRIGYGERQIMQVSNQIIQKTGMATTSVFGYSWFDFVLNGKCYRIHETGYYSYFHNLNGKIYEISDNGHLANCDDWSKEIAIWLARDENIEMTDAHWEIINFMREYYEEYKIAPMIKILVKAIAKKLGPEKGNTKYLYELFPVGPAAQANKIAGLPMPRGQF